uniref:Uncharacterized protein n=1 Tax=Setaria viridis TaxID=4556 RepID=A0A4U6UD11_SETVI|nr:hypothetical protein SEVIR_6G236751v2 [Setaria viridis]
MAVWMVCHLWSTLRSFSSIALGSASYPNSL